MPGKPRLFTVSSTLENTLVKSAFDLRDRNLLDAAVQEAYLAVPYAFMKLGANSQAAQYYEQALSSFDSEQKRIDEAIAARNHELARIAMTQHLRSGIARLFPRQPQ